MIDVSSVIRAIPMLISVKLFPKTRLEENENGKKENLARNNVKSIRFNILLETSLFNLSSLFPLSIKICCSQEEEEEEVSLIS